MSKICRLHIIWYCARPTQHSNLAVTLIPSRALCSATVKQKAKVRNSIDLRHVRVACSFRVLSSDPWSWYPRNCVTPYTRPISAVVCQKSSLGTWCWSATNLKNVPHTATVVQCDRLTRPYSRMSWSLSSALPVFSLGRQRKIFCGSQSYTE